MFHLRYVHFHPLNVLSQIAKLGVQLCIENGEFRVNVVLQVAEGGELFEVLSVHVRLKLAELVGLDMRAFR